MIGPLPLRWQMLPNVAVPFLVNVFLRVLTVRKFHCLHVDNTDCTMACAIPDFAVGSNLRFN